MEFDFKQNRYIPNRNTLEQMCEQMSIPTYSKSVYTSSSKISTSKPINSTVSKSSSSDNINWGCVICIIVIVFGGIIGLTITQGELGGFIMGCAITAGIIAKVKD